MTAPKETPKPADDAAAAIDEMAAQIAAGPPPRTFVPERRF